MKSNIVSDPGGVSHWMKQLYKDAPLRPRPSLQASREADVCIVGAGYSGLYTAYTLKREDPSLEIVMLEAVVAGYGASGRNGGAVLAQFIGSREYWTKRAGTRDAAIAMERASQDTLLNIQETVERENIECGFNRAGVVRVARSELEVEMLHGSVEEDRKWGLTEDDTRWLSQEETLDRIKIKDALGARYSVHCASVDPGRLVRGLADVVERMGVTIYEDTPVAAIEPHVAKTESGLEVKARFVVRTTEAYTQSLKTHKNVICPIHTSMIVTEVIPDTIWNEIGWQNREALLAEHRFLHLQHTTDHRITIGGDDNRLPYKWGSAPSPEGPAGPKQRAMYARELVELFPALEGIGFDHSWQGIFGAPSNWAPGVSLDRESGLGWHGGYAGEGVGLSNLGGRTLADLILGRDTELTRLPFVGAPPKRWKPEPLRMVGAGLIAGLRRAGDLREIRTGKESRLHAVAAKVSGYTGWTGG
ncbi:MAG TPA: FAD-dependent oxidoreductase [Baekduia sp.]|nr:FAD-dependent oxidoreductase [Baekduia sp.]